MERKRPSTPTFADEKKKIARREDIIKVSLFSPIIKEKLSNAIKEGIGFKSECGLLLYNQPFPCFLIKDFFSDTNFVYELKNELLQLTFSEKSNDLFKFKQSKDLVEHMSKNMLILQHTLYTTFREWLQEVMCLSLDTTTDISCAKYDYTDVLLCHDDELEGRRIAFIYYLVPEDWDENDGGSLDLFSMDVNRHPDTISHSIVPTFNSLVFFEVSEKSFHQVSEVISKSKTRMTISGWYHGKSLPHRTPNLLPKIILQPPIPMEDELLLSWVNPIYLNPEIVSDIKEQFEDNSEIQLKDFLVPSKYVALVKELICLDIPWNKQGPPNQRMLWLLPDGLSSCNTVYEFLSLIKSVPFFKLLKTLTALDMAILQSTESDDEEEDLFEAPPVCVAEVRQWKHGCYTLLHDQDHCGAEFALDALFHLHCDNYDEDMDGGYISYIANDGGDELMRVHPTSNCLSLVYRDEETSRFVKYFNKLCEESCIRYYDVSAVYFEGVKK